MLHYAQMAYKGSDRPFAAVATKVRKGPLVTVRGEGSGLIAAPSTFRHKGRTAAIRCASHQCLLCGAVSTGGRNTGLKFLCWCLILQGLSRPLVELACDSAEFGLAEARYISAFGEVLSEKAVGIFVAPALPRRLRIAKIDIDIRGDGEFSMPRHL